MGFRFLDSVDRYSTTTGVEETYEAASTGYTVETSGGRFGGGAFKVAPAGFVRCGSGTSSGSLREGELIRHPFYSGTSNKISNYAAGPLIRFQRESFHQEIGTVNLRADGGLDVVSPTFGTQASSAASVVPLDAWFRLEIRFQPNDELESDGEVTIKINGTTVLEETGLTFINIEESPGDPIVVDAVQFMGSSTDTFWDDIILWDGRPEFRPGDPYTDNFIGDVRIDILSATADTSDEDWDKSSGTESFEMVNDPPLVDNDGDSTYISTPDDSIYKTLHEHEDLALESADIKGVHVVVTGREETPNSRDVIGMVESNGIPAFNGSSDQLQFNGSTYKPREHAYFQDPDTGSPWTVNGVNDAVYGVIQQPQAG